MRDGLRRRRFALAGAGSAMAVAVLAAAALVAGSNQQSDSLRVDQPASHATSAGSTSSGTDRTSDSAAVLGTTGAGQSAPAGSYGAPTPRPLNSPPESAGPTASPASKAPVHGPVTRRESELGDKVCSGNGVSVGTDGVGTGNDWCLEVAGPDYRNTTPYAPATLTFTVCRSMAKNAAPLTFATAQEVDFQIATAKGSKKLWTWSTGHRFRSSKHTLQVDTGRCFDWQTTWTWTDDRGKPVPPGQTLRLTAWSTSRELGSKEMYADFEAPSR
jgi:hypothetical protein